MQDHDRVPLRGRRFPDQAGHREVLPAKPVGQADPMAQPMGRGGRRFDQPRKISPIGPLHVGELAIGSAFLTQRFASATGDQQLVDQGMALMVGADHQAETVSAQCQAERPAVTQAAAKFSPIIGLDGDRRRKQEGGPGRVLAQQQGHRLAGLSQGQETLDDAG
ncbi:hypothetical protein CWS72_25845 [Telmatospirillum siberiense]|uniref:Uncharacterized protein n=1 Tax=Telmatospirillum siberiense TaxID=382514 RepID=A0A2N3PML6_9PROT|nr:hypothetical protein CWS72_25845 [Telmatospirillum siberiense]